MEQNSSSIPNRIFAHQMSSLSVLSCMYLANVQVYGRYYPQHSSCCVTCQMGAVLHSSSFPMRRAANSTSCLSPLLPLQRNLTMLLTGMGTDQLAAASVPAPGYVTVQTLSVHSRYNLAPSLICFLHSRSRPCITTRTLLDHIPRHTNFQPIETNRSKLSS